MAEPSDRRQVERRGDALIAELSLPELRRIVLTTALFAVVLGLFLWMVRAVFVAGVLGVVAATYTRPAAARSGCSRPASGRRVVAGPAPGVA